MNYIKGLKCHGYGWPYTKQLSVKGRYGTKANYEVNK